MKLVFASGLSQILGAFHALLFTYLATNSLSPSEFGDVRYIMSILPILMLFSLPSYDGVILRSIVKKIRLSLFNVTIARVLGGILGSIVLVVYLCANNDLSPELIFLMSCLVLLLPFFETTTGFRNYLIGLRLKSQAVKLLTINKILSIFFLMIAYWSLMLLEVNFLWIFPFYILSLIVPNLISWSSFCHNLSTKSSINTNSIYLKSAIVTTFASGLGTLAFSLDKILIKNNLGSEKLAYYSILVMVPLELAKLVDSLIPIFYRRIMSSPKQIAKSKVIAIVFFCFSSLFLLACFLFFVYPLFFGDFYTYSFFDVLCACFFIISGGVEFYFVHKTYYLGYNRALLLYSFVSVIITFAMLGFLFDFESILLIVVCLFTRQLIQPLIFLSYFKRWS